MVANVVLAPISTYFLTDLGALNSDFCVSILYICHSVIGIFKPNPENLTTEREVRAGIYIARSISRVSVMSYHT